MPAPSSNPTPSPKAPPVCKKGPKKPDGPALAPNRRPLTGSVLTLSEITEVPAAINASFTFYPLGITGHWQGIATQDDTSLEIFIFKNPTDDNYAIELYMYSFGSLISSKSWTDVAPRSADPMEFADLSYKDPLTNTETTLTIIS